MRPYRAIPIDGKDFVYGWYIETEGKSYIVHRRTSHHIKPTAFGPFYLCYYEVIPESVGQQIGLKDKNGKGTNEVYEGDIVICSCEPAPKIHYKGVIKYTAPEFYLACFWEDINGEQCSFPVGDNNRSLASGFWSIDEILGNIHQHPNILEQDK